MNTLEKYTPFFTSALLMYVMLFIIYPHYQYYVDPDGTAYLTISRRYAEGDFQKAVNGYWSPWSCWLTALLIKAGISVLPASWLVNIAGATGFLFISQSFFLKFNIISKLQWLLNVTLALFLCYAVFWQSFDDLWECFFLLSTLRIMLADGFTKQPVLWIVSGIIGALAYFAKAYSFPFFILNTLCCVYLLTRGNKKKWLQISVTSIAVMFVCSLPWIIALHNKYHIWTTSTAGSLNMSWYLVGHPHWKDGIMSMIPPVYPDSPSYWEDPWFANGPTPHFWDSWGMFISMVVRFAFNVYKFIVSNFQLSVFFPVIFVVSFFSLFRRKIRLLFSDKARVAAISFLLFPLAFFLINFEARYLWYMVPLAMVFGAITIQSINGQGSRVLFLVVFPLSFLIYPFSCMKRMYNEGANEYAMAQKIRSLGIHGSFTCETHPGIESQRMQRLAYFSGNSFYTYVYNLKYPPPLTVFAEIDRFKVNYYFLTSDAQKEPTYRSSLSQKFPELTHGAIPGLHIFKIHP